MTKKNWLVVGIDGHAFCGRMDVVGAGSSGGWWLSSILDYYLLLAVGWWLVAGGEFCVRRSCLFGVGFVGCLCWRSCVLFSGQ